MGRSSGVKDWSLESGRRRPGDASPVGRTPPSSGYRRHPIRPYLTRAERDNPVGVRRRQGVYGKPTARKARFSSGRRMASEANAGGRKETGNRDIMVGSSAGCLV